MHKLRSFFLHSFLPLLAGGLLYIGFRSTDLRMFGWFQDFGIENLVDHTRSTLQPIGAILPAWIHYSLPDGLWVYSFTSALILYWGEEIEKNRIWLLIPFCGGVLVEPLQGMRLFPGTFDILDMIMSISGFILSILILKNKQHEKQVC